MADKYFMGKAQKIAQVSKATVGGTLSGETFTISVGGVDIVSHTDDDTVIATTVAALVSGWNSSSHPYATVVTATDESPDVVLTADIPGVPFDVDLSTPGGSATFVETTPTENSGPNVLDLANNWDSDVLPQAADNLHFADNMVNVCWGLEGLAAITVTDIFFHHTHAGRDGLDYQVFATSANGESVTREAVEYRPTKLKLKLGGVLVIGREDVPGKGSGSPRLNLDLQTSACVVDVRKTSTVSVDVGRNACRIVVNHSTTDIFVRNGCAGGVGIGTDVPNETGQYRHMKIAQGPLVPKVTIGSGVTHSTFVQHSGDTLILSEPSSSLVIKGGSCTTEGDYTVTTITVNEGATLYSNHIRTSGNCVTTIHVYGTVETRRNQQSRVFNNVKLYPTGHFYYDEDVVTVTTWDHEGSGDPI